MEPSEYLEERLEGQQKWYSAKSTINKNYHNWLRITTIIISVLIPLVSGFEKYVSDEVSIVLWVGILGTVVAILTAISGFMKFKEKWIGYRMASERLKRERLFWVTKTGPYVEDGTFHLLVNRVEAIIGTENGEWVDYIGGEPTSKR